MNATDIAQLSPLLARLAREACAQAVAQASPVYRPATVQAFAPQGALVTVIIDGDTGTVQVQNLCPNALSLNQRVMVLGVPPNTAFVVGQITPPPGSRQLFYEMVVTAANAAPSYTLQVPQTFKHLHYEITAGVAGGGMFNVGLEYNGIGGANYPRSLFYQQYGPGAGNVLWVSDTTLPYVHAGIMPAVAGTLGQFTGFVGDYRRVHSINTTVFGNGLDGVGSFVIVGGVLYIGQGPITSIRCLTGNGANFTTDTTIRWFGEP